MTDPTPDTPAEKPGILARAQAKQAAARPRVGVENWVFGIRDEVAELLTGSAFEVDSYLQNAYRVVEASPQLREATSQAGATVLGAIMLGATLQLPIGGPLGQFYLTPRTENYNKPDQRTVCVPMLGYRGFFELGYRSGLIRSFDYIIRREGDTYRQGATSERGKFFDWEQFHDGEFDENDEAGNKRELTGVVALAYDLRSPAPSWQFMSRSAIERRRPAFWKSTPWNGKDQEAMYVKTPHRELAKFLQLSIQTAKAVEADEMISAFNKVTGAIDTLRDDTTVVDVATATVDAPQSAQEAPASEPVTEPSNAQQPAERDPEQQNYEQWLAEQAAEGTL